MHLGACVTFIIIECTKAHNDVFLGFVTSSTSMLYENRKRLQVLAKHAGSYSHASKTSFNAC